MFTCDCPTMVFRTSVRRNDDDHGCYCSLKK